MIYFKNDEIDIILTPVVYFYSKVAKQVIHESYILSFSFQENIFLFFFVLNIQIKYFLFLKSCRCQKFLKKRD